MHELTVRCRCQWHSVNSHLDGYSVSHVWTSRTRSTHVPVVSVVWWQRDWSLHSSWKTRLSSAIQNGEDIKNCQVPNWDCAGDGPAFPNRTFAASSESAVPCRRSVVITWRITLSLSRPDVLSWWPLACLSTWHSTGRRSCVEKSTSSTLEESKGTGQHFASKWCHRKLGWGVSTPLHRAECFMRNYQVFSSWRNSPHFMEPDG